MFRQINRVLLVLFCLLFMGAPAFGEESVSDTSVPSLMSSLRLAKPRDFCKEPVPVSDPDVRERFEKEFMLSLWDQPQAILWLKRSTRCFPLIEKLLRQNGLPDDLKYVAIAESALRPHAGSSKGAMGYWQFMEETGKRYGLTINPHIDERRNLMASTRAAVQYFKELHAEFGSWTLAAAAYNMGEKGLMAEILEQQTDDYYALYLPLETQRFLFRILSIKLILESPETFGFELRPGDAYPPDVSEAVTLTSNGDVPIRLLAQAAKTRFKVIKDLNPEIRGYYLGPGDHQIQVPKGAGPGFLKRLKELRKEASSLKHQRLYVVRKGDSLSSIARKFNVPLAAIIIWNRIDPKSPIHPGDRIIVHPGGQ